MGGGGWGGIGAGAGTGATGGAGTKAEIREENCYIYIYMTFSNSSFNTRFCSRLAQTLKEIPLDKEEINNIPSGNTQTYDATKGLCM